MRRVHMSGRTQMMGAGFAALACAGALFSLGQVAVSTVEYGVSISGYSSGKSKVAVMEDRVEALQDEVTALKTAAKGHAERLEARHAALTSLLKGSASEETLAGMVPALEQSPTSADDDVELAFATVGQDQVALAKDLQLATDARYEATRSMMTRLGLGAADVGGMGGPFEPVPATTQVAAAAAAPSVVVPLSAPIPVKADPQFRALFDSWKRLDRLQTSMISVPSQKPVDSITVNSGFGVRRDPFRGGRAMHAGVDIPGPIGTPIYATADAIVGRTGWVGGYGNMIELEHGKGIQTRYGHLSGILVAAGTRIKRGQKIGMMGSTGRSTGSHLHYEVRIDGKAVNPRPFLQTADYLLAMQQRTDAAVAQGGPEEGAAKAAAAK